jgi:hypothetical protein
MHRELILKQDQMHCSATSVLSVANAFGDVR